MSTTRQYIQGTVAIAVMIIGIYMLVNFDWPTPPAISGLGFLLAGFGLWTPHCIFLNLILRDKKKVSEGEM